MKNKGLRVKSLEFYQLEKDKFFEHEVDFENILHHLSIDAPTCEDIFMKVEIEPQTFVDPVIDPRESWMDMAKRIGEFEGPK